MILFTMDFPRGLAGKESAYNAGDLGSISGLGRSPGEGNGNPFQVFFPGKSHGQRSLASYSSWGRKESEKTEQLSTHRAQWKLRAGKTLEPSAVGQV